MKTKKLLVSASIALATIPSLAHAVIVQGMPSCGAWVSAREEKSIAEFTNESWVIGYLSGIAHVSRKDILKGPSRSASFFLWIDNYCKAHPLDDVDDAANVLADELIARQGR